MHSPQYRVVVDTYVLRGKFA